MYCIYLCRSSNRLLRARARRWHGPWRAVVAHSRAAQMLRCRLLLAAAALAVLPVLARAHASGLGTIAATTSPCLVVVVAPASSKLTQLAAHELRRYAWHSTGVLARIQHDDASAAPPSCHRIVLAEGGSCKMLLGSIGAAAAGRVLALRASEHLILSPAGGDQTMAVVAGSDGQGVLYAAYRFAEEVLGIHFSIGGDVLPLQCAIHPAWLTRAGAWLTSRMPLALLYVVCSHSTISRKGQTGGVTTTGVRS